MVKKMIQIVGDYFTVTNSFPEHSTFLNTKVNANHNVGLLHGWRCSDLVNAHVRAADSLACLRRHTLMILPGMVVCSEPNIDDITRFKIISGRTTMWPTNNSGQHPRSEVTYGGKQPPK